MLFWLVQEKITGIDECSMAQNCDNFQLIDNKHASDIITQSNPDPAIYSDQKNNFKPQTSKAKMLLDASKQENVDYETWTSLDSARSISTKKTRN